MDESIKSFFTKNADKAYIDQYDKDHGPRLDALVSRYSLDKIVNCSVVDVGGGLGFLGKRLNKEIDYWVVDGACIPPSKQLCHGTWIYFDLDYDRFGSYEYVPQGFDCAFCLETLEHLTNPYNCIAETKKIVKENGEIYISIPHENVTHNAIYPGLLWPIHNFEQFLGQMALEIVDRWTWESGWNAYNFKCINKTWDKKKMMFPKHEEKFKNATPVEMVNL